MRRTTKTGVAKKRLYHGTTKPLPKGTRKIHPTPQDGAEGGYQRGWKLAHATSSLAEARSHGAVVYEVEYDEHTQEGYGETAYISEQGFRIIRLVATSE